ncbi:hypothetical protein AB4Z48_17885 [Cupriavidus sp. 2TAF22]|uniref:hypothetical protein n=1 Tax=unclassified Cupriavidus TaxID=2640874 RepID=UPI003F9362D8
MKQIAADSLGRCAASCFRYRLSLLASYCTHLLSETIMLDVLILMASSLVLAVLIFKG